MKKLITSLLALLCVFGFQPITMYAEENSTEDSNTNTDNKDKETIIKIKKLRMILVLHYILEKRVKNNA